jgi:hypothetical protein
MRMNAHQLRRWLSHEVLGREIPREPPPKDRCGPARDPAYRVCDAGACDSREGLTPDLDAVRAFERQKLAGQYGDLIRQRVERR